MVEQALLQHTALISSVLFAIWVLGTLITSIVISVLSFRDQFSEPGPWVSFGRIFSHHVLINALGGWLLLAIFGAADALSWLISNATDLATRWIPALRLPPEAAPPSPDNPDRRSREIDLTT